MPDFTKRVTKGIAADLQPGEQVIKALSAQPPGSLTRGINESGGNTVGGISRGRKEKQAHGQQAVGMAASIPPRNVFITLTDRRLLVHTMSKLGSTQDLVAEFGFDQIQRLDLDEGRFGSGTIDLVFADETGVDFLIVSRQRPEAFMAAWETVRS